MKHDRITHGSLEYCLYRFGKSRSRFRGPRPDLSRPYIACLGGSETFGRFVPHSYAQLLQSRLGMTCANFARPNAGPGFFLDDPSVLLAAREARAVVIAVMGAQNLSNRFYRVHPRHNDRVIATSDFLKTLFPALDGGDIHYTGHLLETLSGLDPERFQIVVEELKIAWVARMTALLERVKGRTILLWAADHAPPEPTDSAHRAPLAPAPRFVDQAMLDRISPLATRVVEYTPSDQARAAGTGGMVHTPAEADAARCLPGVKMHAEIANLLAGVFRDSK